MNVDRAGIQILALQGALLRASNAPLILMKRSLANQDHAWQSSCLPRYSQRLSWNFSSNAESVAIDRKRRAGVPLLDLTISNPTQVFPDYPHEEIRRAYAGIGDFSYQPDPLGLETARQALAQWYLTQRIAMSPTQLLLTASSSEAYALLFKVLCDPQDEILAPIPSYPLFEFLAALESVRMVPYRLLYDGAWFIDFADLRNRISSRTRAIIIVNPNNPAGSFLKKREREELFDVARRFDLPILSDEVFAAYSFGSDPDRVNTLIDNDSVLSFSLNGLSKPAGMPQMKLGWIAIGGPPKERDMARERLEIALDTYLSVGTPVQRALPELLTIGEILQSMIRERIRCNLNALRQLLKGNSAYPLHLEGGWSAVLQFPQMLSEEEWTSRLLEAYDVIVQPGYFFDMISEPYVVVSLLTPPELFAEGIRRLRQLTMGV